MTTAEEKKALSGYMQRLWRVYLACLDRDKWEDSHYDDLIRATETIWRESGQSELIGGMASEFIKDIERRIQKNGK